MIRKFRRRTRYSVHVAVIALLATGCAAAAAGRGDRAAREGEIRASFARASGRSAHTEYLDPVVAAAQLSPLHRVDPPPTAAVQEVRIWIGGGMFWPQNLYRIVRHADGRVTGSAVLYWWQSDDSTSVPSAGRRRRTRSTDDYLEMVAYLRGRCDHFSRGTQAATCRTRFTVPPDWAAMLSALESRGLWTLPDESTLPRSNTIINDGWSITVELRAGPQYRAYRYGNPDQFTAPEAQRAAAVAGVLHSLADTERPRDAIGVYRGITVGRYQREFRPCGMKAGTLGWQFEGELESQYYRTRPGADSASAAQAILAAGADTPKYVEVRGELYPESAASERGSASARLLQVHEVLAVRAWTGAECSARGGR